MAGAKTLKAQAFIKISDTESVLWYEVLDSGEVVWYLPKDEANKYKKSMTERMGREMSLYLNNNPDASMWKSTNAKA